MWHLYVKVGTTTFLGGVLFPLKGSPHCPLSTDRVERERRGELDIPTETSEDLTSARSDRSEREEERVRERGGSVGERGERERGEREKGEKGESLSERGEKESGDQRQRRKKR
jgi:hypothetical protein